MDPNKCLEEIRKTLADLAEALAKGTPNPEIAAEDLASYICDLDAWLAAGGFLPDDWAKGRPKT